MPEVARIAGAVIKINTREHPPPHVHVYYQGREVRLKIADGVALNPTDRFHAGVLTAVRQWLAGNRHIAANMWAKYHGLP